MTNNEMIQNEVIAEGVAVEDVVETTSKGGKGLAILVIGGIALAIGVGLYKKYRKKAAKATEQDEIESV